MEKIWIRSRPPSSGYIYVGDLGLCGIKTVAGRADLDTTDQVHDQYCEIGAG